METQKIRFSSIDQLCRSGCPVGANVREGKAGRSNNELIGFYEIALGSANETDFWLNVISEGYDDIHRDQFQSILSELDEISRVIGAIVASLKKGLHQNSNFIRE